MDASSSDPLPPLPINLTYSLMTLYLYGLIGKTLIHSFSQKYFLEKFRKEDLQDHYYELFPLDDIDDIRLLLEVHKNLMGAKCDCSLQGSGHPLSRRIRSASRRHWCR
jgi:shikimate dehydrogenase